MVSSIVFLPDLSRVESPARGRSLGATPELHELLMPSLSTLDQCKPCIILQGQALQLTVERKRESRLTHTVTMLVTRARESLRLWTHQRTGKPLIRRL